MTTTGGSSFSNLGGGVYNFLGTLNIEFSTFTLNEAAAGKGSGIASLGDTNAAITRLHSTIVAGNVNSDIDRVVGLQNSVVSQGYNLYGSGTAAVAFNSSGDKPLIGSLLLGPLADNGGPTPTHAVLPFSPALDAGDSNAEAGFGNVPLPEPAVCAWCGTTAAELPLTWTVATEGGRRKAYCDRCSREHLRSIEGKLDSDWW